MTYNKKFAEELWKKHDKTCPTCGHCPTCGRSNDWYDWYDWYVGYSRPYVTGQEPPAYKYEISTGGEYTCGPV